MIKVAKEFGISDRGLAKTCARLEAQYLALPFVDDCVLERNEFEPAVPILEQPDDSWLFGWIAL